MNEDYLLNKRILLVDDEQELLDMVLSILTEYGFQNVKAAQNVKEAMEQAEKNRPELAILDVMLPDGNGFALMEQLKKLHDEYTEKYENIHKKDREAVWKEYIQKNKELLG